MSDSGSAMRAQGLRGTVAFVGFLALIVIAAWFGGCGLVGKAGRSSNAGDATSTPPTSSGPPLPVPSVEAIPRGTAVPTLPLPQLADVPKGDATQVSKAALTVLFTYDTTTDTTAHDAAVRAAPWMTTEFASAQREQLMADAPGMYWTTWASHQAYTVPTLTPGGEDAPPDTATDAYRQWIVRYTPVGRDGWQGEPSTVVVFVTLARTTASDPWRVSGVLVRS